MWTVLLLWCVAVGAAVLPQPQDNGTRSRVSDDYEYAQNLSWPSLDGMMLGTVSAVALDTDGSVVILHRGSHVWNGLTFDSQERYLPFAAGPIAEQTILSFHPDTGRLLDEWGADFFFMPHGLTIDAHRNHWITDVGLHQVFKFNLNQSKTVPMLTLGQRFSPGNGLDSFCKPTSVAVLDSGEFFVADGYCNGRIVKFSEYGQPILQWGRNSFQYTRTFTLQPNAPIPESFFAIPHALTLAPDKGLLCVADREQGRVQCFHTVNGTFHSQHSNPAIGSRYFSVQYIPEDGGLLYIVNGPASETTEVAGYILSMTTGGIVGKFLPDNGRQAFSNPHDLRVTPGGGEVYVAELDPRMVHKFRRIGVSKPLLLQVPPAEGELRDTSNTVYASGLGIISIVGTLLVTSFLVILLSRLLCFRRHEKRTEGLPLHNLDDH